MKRIRTPIKEDLAVAASIEDAYRSTTLLGAGIVSLFVVLGLTLLWVWWLRG